MSSTTTSSGGVSTASLLGVVFIVLKLTHVIAWPWIWVLAPFWLGLALLLGFLIVVGLAFLLFAALK